MNLTRNLKIRGNKTIFAGYRYDIMNNTNDEKAFYAKLKIQLEETTTFPSQYLYKFIVPTSDQKIQEVIDIFDNLGAVINTKKSKTGKYTSISIQLNMKDADAVIRKYKEVSKVEGVISL